MKPEPGTKFDLMSRIDRRKAACSFGAIPSTPSRGNLRTASRHSRLESTSFDKRLRSFGRSDMTSETVTGGYDGTKNGNGVLISERMPRIITRCLDWGIP